MFELPPIDPYKIELEDFEIFWANYVEICHADIVEYIRKNHVVRFVSIIEVANRDTIQHLPDGTAKLLFNVLNPYSNMDIGEVEIVLIGIAERLKERG